MRTERHLLITISAGDERCGFCTHRSVGQSMCMLFMEPIASAGDAKSPGALLRCADCIDAEQKASERS